MQKRGISALVATVLIVLISVVGVTILWVGVIPMVNQNLDIQNLDARLDVVTSGGYTAYDADDEVVSVQVKRGNDNSNISEIKFVIDFDGNSVSHVNSSVPGPNQAKTYLFNIAGMGEPNHVKIIPIFSDGEEGVPTSDVKIPRSDLANIEDVVDFGPECSSDLDCGSDGYVCDGLNRNYEDYSCVDEVCVLDSILDQNCDDGNECTVDSCGVGGCDNINEPDFSICSLGVCIDGDCESPSWMNGLVSWWDFEDISADLVYDKVGNNDGDVFGDVSSISGYNGQSIVFNNVGSYVNFGDVLDLLNNDWTYSFWLKTSDDTDSVNRPRIIEKGAGAGVNGLRIEMGPDNRGMAIFGGTSGYRSFSGPTLINDNQWHHIAIVIDRDGYAIWYTDGNPGNPVDISAYVSQSVNVPYPLIISSNSLTFLGEIDEVMVFNRPLSSSDVSEVYGIF